MHDNNMPSGESTVRQYLFAKRYFREKLGYDVTTGWGLDTFHNAQMPQILNLAGMKSYWFQRGVPGIETPSEFNWQSIDGSQIPAFWLPISYAPLHNIPHSPADFERMVTGRFAQLDRYTRGTERVLMAGADVWEPEEHLPEMLAQFNRSEKAPFALRFAVPSEFESVVARRRDLPIVKGELNPVFQGIYSTRIEVKQAMRELERMLTTAEKLSVLGDWLGTAPDRQMQERAWEPVLFNQAHDLASGVMVDKVYDDSMMAYSHSRRLAVEMLREGMERLVSRIRTAGPGIPVVVFNSLGWPRSDVAETDVALSDAGVQSLGLVDPEGKAVPVQFLRTERNADGGLRFARIAFVARDVPAIGYAVYRAVPNAAPASSHAAPAGQGTSHEDRGTIENEFYKASFDLWTGDMTSLVLKESGWEVLAGPANVVAREYDGGDFWELYGTLNGGRLTAMHKKIGLPRPSLTQRSSDFVGGSGSTRNGPVFSEFRIAHPFGKNHFTTRVRLYRGLRRIDINTQIVNQEEFVRYRVLFPTSIASGAATHEIPFGAIERPAEQESPAQNWVDYGDGKRGVTLLNVAMPGNNVASGTMMLSLLRSTRLISYGYIGGFEPGVGSDTALGIGKRYTLDYGLVPHAGDWRDALSWRSGLELNQPLIAQVAANHEGDLPARWGMLEISQPNVVLSALKPAQDGSWVVRVYEASGRPARDVRLAFRPGLSAAETSNLIEDSTGQLDMRNGDLRFDLRAYEIATFKVRPRQGKPAK
jgi:alpha-mannosidase